MRTMRLREGEMGEYLTFRKHYTPGIIHVLFWILLFANTLDAFFGGHDFWGAVFTLFVGPVLLRIVCELILVLFEINDSLIEIRNSPKPAPVEVFTPSHPLPAANPPSTPPPPSNPSVE
jgi:hypothetical protein